jgi:organic radical activating enzyme
MEQFYTLQGEGAWTGTSAYFIRLAGCDVGCVWCDVKESWEVREDQWQTVEKICEAAKNSGAEIVVITGGEPAMYDLNPLTEILHKTGLRVHLETSGTSPLSGNFDWICISPKKFKPAIDEWYAIADELKIIVFNKSDFSWAEDHAMKCNRAKTRLYLQPEWSKKDFTGMIIDYIKAHPHWRLSLQTHKFTGIP